MTSVFAIVRRILTQFALDKRTLALLFVAPLVVLWLLSVILGADTVGPKIATVDLPAELDRKSTRLNSSHDQRSRMPSSA